MNTEAVNPKTSNISNLDTPDILKLINDEDRTVADVVRECIPQISLLVEEGYKALSNGNRIFYCGAGTSGRLSVADAAELPPTYGTDPEQVKAIIAGGVNAMLRASEGCEDSRERALQAFEESGCKAGDLVIGVSASGGAPYVRAFMEKAKEVGCTVGAIVNNENTLMSQIADITVAACTGAEVIKGSTRMKAGTAQKMILNMLSTCAMVKTGKVYENLMINLKPTNIKLTKRMIGIVCDITGVNEETAKQLLDENDWKIRDAVDSYLK